jgi:hypothetical protein
MRNTQDPR